MEKLIKGTILYHGSYCRVENIDLNKCLNGKDFGMKDSDLKERMKESTALATLQRAMEKYSKQKEISFDAAVLDFFRSTTYGMLFDFDSMLWTQGPDYLIDVYEGELQSRECKAV